jgi:hypothetical protein
VNDNDLITAVRQSVGGVRMSIPAEDIISRSRAIRARRRIPVAAAALTAAAGMALAVSSLAAPGHRAAIQLTAWTVVSKPGRFVSITIHELRDPAGLQRKLRADGLPASVTYNGRPNHSCRPYPLGIRQLEQVFPLPQPAPGKWTPVIDLGQVGTPGKKPRPGYVLVIVTAALPPGTGVQIAATVRHQLVRFAEPKVVYARPSCTGS